MFYDHTNAQILIKNSDRVVWGIFSLSKTYSIHPEKAHLNNSVLSTKYNSSIYSEECTL